MTITTIIKKEIDIMNQPIFTLTSPSGAGKTFIAKALQSTHYWNEVISTTTRDMREGEVEGETYYYKDEKTFDKMVEDGEFAEFVYYDGNSYGITKAEIERVSALGKPLVIIVEHNGYKQIKDIYPEAIGIFIHMSKEDCLTNMLLRGDSYDKAIARIKTYDAEMLNRIYFDYVIKNVRGKQNEIKCMIKQIVNQHQNIKPTLTLDNHYKTRTINMENHKI